MITKVFAVAIIINIFRRKGCSNIVTPEMLSISVLMNVVI